MDEAKIKINQLISQYKTALSSGKVKKYTEEETKKDFILPLFKILGWDTSSREEVTAEESQSSGRVDYGFYLNGRIKFYVETKKLSSDLHNEDYAKQAIRYSWNKGVDWAILTDFESIKIFYCQDPTQSLFSKLLFEIRFDEYIDRFDQLWLLSKELFKTNAIDSYAQKIGKKLQKISVGDQLYKHLNECRKLLVDKLGQWNDIKDQNLLDEGVQKLLDRLVFIRVAEDRGIEPSTLIPLIRAWESEKSGKQIYETMIDKFREFDDIYNSNLFQPHPFEKWKESGGATQKVIEILQGKPGYYEYDFSVLPADVLGAVYENYLGYKLAESQKKVTTDKSAKKRKEQGIYYTPEFIVDYIIKNALGPVLDKCRSISDLKKVKVLDPACGSGSFLIKALEVINKKYKEFGNKGDEYTKIQILQENLYGVDLDEQAVEIARLNLLLNSLEKQMKLPKLENIKNGNSLISGTDQELKKYFGDNYRDKRPFNWEEEFPGVFKQGGFDVIIGNPPYGASYNDEEKGFYKEKFAYKSGKPETYIYFIEKALSLLKEHGLLGFIVPNAWLTNYYGIQLRTLLLNNFTFRQLVDLEPTKVFSAVVDTVIFTASKTKDIKENMVGVSRGTKDSQIKHLFYTNQTEWLKDSELIININSDDKDQEIQRKVEGSGVTFSSLAYYSQGVIPYKTKEEGESNLFISIKKRDKEWLPLLENASSVERYKVNYSNKYIKYGPWLWCPREIKFFQNPKILFHRLRKKLPVQLIGAIDMTGVINRHSLSNLILKPGVKKENLLALLGLFNSKLENWWFVKKYGKLMEVGGFKVLKIPLPKDFEKNDGVLVNFVIKMLSLQKELGKVQNGTNRWMELKDETEKVDRKIDEEVYKLYGLTPEEIAIVERVTKN